MKLYIMAAVMLILANVANANEDVITQDKYPEHYCLALNIYYEARGSNLADKAAVSDVVLNRVNDTRYPNTICEVVKQGEKHANGNMVRNRCQFSWYCDGKADEIVSKENNHAWRTAQDIAFNVMVFNKYSGLVEGATHYHADYVDPSWNKTITLVTKIDDHIFYRWD